MDQNVRLSALIIVLVGAAVVNAIGAVESRAQDLPTAPVQRASPSSLNERIYLVDASGIEGIRLGMTLDEARKARPAAKFERASDGDGVALVTVTLSPNASIVISADEDDADQPINWSKTIKSIETFSPAFRTREGVGPGSLINDVEKIFGKTMEIVESEIESRQYISFEKQPAWLILRLDYSGIFPSDSRRTTRFRTGARLHSIIVTSP